MRKMLAMVLAVTMLVSFASVCECDDLHHQRLLHEHHNVHEGA